MAEIENISLPRVEPASLASQENGRTPDRERREKSRRVLPKAAQAPDGEANLEEIKPEDHQVDSLA
jgi:hypothetical protein